LDADIAGAAAAGLDSALVLTGTATAAEAKAADPAPIAVAPDFASLVLAR
jgi:ribonucleotide monophosphatase NagD (HAD superfamily)